MAVSDGLTQVQIHQFFAGIKFPDGLFKLRADARPTQMRPKRIWRLGVIEIPIGPGQPGYRYPQLADFAAGVMRAVIEDHTDTDTVLDQHRYQVGGIGRTVKSV